MERLPMKKNMSAQDRFSGILVNGFRHLVILVAISALTACAAPKPYQITMMPAPDAFADGAFNPFPDSNPDKWVPYGGMLYATDREPVTDETRTEAVQFYQNERGFLLRLGVGKITVKKEGVTWEEEKLPPATVEYLQSRSDLNFINATNAASSDTGNGHAYFRKSPWVSSDVLMTLAFVHSPAERGLKLSTESPTWTFPPDYDQRVRAILLEADPALEKK
jgi:hypothetical protein